MNKKNWNSNSIVLNLKKTTKIFSGPMLGLILIVVIFGVITPNFFSIKNFINILNQLPIFGLLAIGMTLVVMTGGIDLSVGCILGLSSMTMGYFAVILGLPFPVAMIFAIIVGTLMGLISGLLVSRINLPPFIATLSMYYVARGLANVITGGEQILGYPNWLMMLSFKKYFGFITATSILFFVILLINHFILEKTSFGRNIYAVGDNEEVARLSGIDTKKYILFVYVASGFLSAVAGILTASKVCASQPFQGNGYELYAIAIAVIGGASLNGGIGSMKGTLIGCFVITILNNGLNLNGVSPFIQTILVGLIISVAVGVDKISRRRQRLIETE